jgi:hypothetical protein
MPTSVWAAGPTLTVSADGGVHTFDREPLLYRMARRSSVIRPNHEMALPSCQFVGARRARQAVALARG